ncbi:MAG TPA: hypothetical protein VGA37_16865 [Gemmatimonadales bacterium]
MAETDRGGNEYVPVAEFEIDTVRPSPTGFSLEGRGGDGAEYLLEMHLDMPIDRRTRTVLAEMLSQSEWRMARRLRRGLRSRRARRAHPATRS